MTRMRDIVPSIIRAQCAANLIRVAREIVSAKISAELKATIADAALRGRDFAEWEVQLKSVKSVGEIMMIESHAARAYWRTFRDDAGLRERKNGNLPRNQHASHPINAMLNYCCIVEAERLAKALAVQGLCLSIGYLRSDKNGRNSLVWDAIEPLRPTIDARVFAFVVEHEFSAIGIAFVPTLSRSDDVRCLTKSYCRRKRSTAQRNGLRN
jgi:CRISPR/Cas system-associated endonuclease Cas1